MKNKKSLNQDLLSKRVFFRNDNTRIDLFDKLKIRFGSWKEIGAYFGIYKSRLENLRTGKISIPYSLFLDFIELLDKEDCQFFHNQIFLKDGNWGRIKGGISTYSKHPSIFLKGRRLRANQIKHNPKYKFAFDTPITPKLCELIGAFIGDGFTAQYNKQYITQFTGDSRFDKDYHLEVLKPIIKALSPESNPIITERDNTIRMTINSKQFHILLTKRFGFPSGKKAYSVKIPEEIMNTMDYNLIVSCIRGIYDTDGCVFYDKRKIYSKPYLRIQLGTVSISLMEQIYSILKTLNLSPREYIDGNKHGIYINGLENCREFVKKIGFSNMRHLDKIRKVINSNA